jgi:hypothetical protein
MLLLLLLLLLPRVGAWGETLPRCCHLCVHAHSVSSLASPRSLPPRRPQKSLSSSSKKSSSSSSSSSPLSSR